MPPPKSIFQILIALLAWTAVGLQFYLIIENRVVSIPETIIRFFSFFTILTNILVAVCFTCLWLFPASTAGRFFQRLSIQTAVTAYITLVGVVYQVLLRQVWDPQGLQKWVDELLHSVIPALVLIYWIAFTPKAGLKWKSAFIWPLYPAVYLAFILIRGSLSGYYPYPFVKVNEIGYKAVMMNCGLILVAFVLFSLLMIALGKVGKKS